MTLLTVSIPTFNTPPKLLERAVKSVLDQTYPDVRCVVVNDGGKTVSLPRHPRLVVYQADRNRGRYWCDALVLAAVDEGWFAVHDADDYSDPDRFARLIDVAAPAGAAIAYYWRHQIDGRVSVQRPRMPRNDAGLHHIGHWCSGVYTVERMAKAGGIHPGFRVGFDTLHTLMMNLTGDLPIDTTPGYHWHRRRGSLSTARDTGQGSRFRHQTKLKLRHLYRDAYTASQRRRPPGKVIRDDVPNAIADRLNVHAEKLRGML